MAKGLQFLQTVPWVIKTAVLTETMQFSDDQATKLWPIYRAYDVELQALKDQKLAGIQEYAKNYDYMTAA